MSDMHKLVIVSAPDKQIAGTIAQTLVSERLAACVNILPEVQSVYQWQEKIEMDAEVILLIKTTADVIDELGDRIKQLHPYELPEFICLTIEQGSSDYLDWITQCIKH